MTKKKLSSDRPIVPLPPKNVGVQQARRRAIVLVVLGCVGIFLIISAIFCTEPIKSILHTKTDRVWSAVASFWSLTFVLYYVTSFRHTSSHRFETLFVAFVVVSLLMPSIALVLVLPEACRLVGFFNEWGINNTERLHLYAIFGVAVVYFLFDLVAWWCHPDKTQRDEYRESFFLADVPTTCAMLVICSWIRIQEIEDGASFVAGVVAFQLITCNVIFFVTQLGLHRAGGIAKFTSLVWPTKP